MTKEKNNKLVLIEPSEYAPGIYYAKPEPIIIEGLDDLIVKADEEIKEYFTDEALDAIGDEDFKAAKALRASLNKRVQAVDARRKEVKGFYTDVLSPFEVQINKLRDTYKGASDRLGARIKEIEDKRKAENRSKAAQYYYDLAPVLADALPYDRVCDERWHNLSFGEKAAEIEIEKVVSQLISDIETIEASCGEWTAQCKVIYFDTLSLSKAFAEKKKLEEIAERTRQMDEERAAIKATQEQAMRKQAEVTEPVVEAVVEPVIEREVVTTTAPGTVSVTLRFEGDANEMDVFQQHLKGLLSKVDIKAFRVLGGNNE